MKAFGRTIFSKQAEKHAAFYISLRMYALLVFSSFMRAHAQAMNKYGGGEISTEVVVDRNLWTEIVGRRRK